MTSYTHRTRLDSLKVTFSLVLDEVKDLLRSYNLVQKPEVELFGCGLCGESLDTEHGLKVHKTRVHNV